jgi:hypothetical protein
VDPVGGRKLIVPNTVIGKEGALRLGQGGRTLVVKGVDEPLSPRVCAGMVGHSRVIC